MHVLMTVRLHYHLSVQAHRTYVRALVVCCCKLGYPGARYPAIESARRTIECVQFYCYVRPLITVRVPYYRVFILY